MPVVDRFRERIVSDGFKPHLDEIVQAITKIWTKHQALPLTILSWMPNGIGYWEPRYTEGSFQEVAAISLYFRHLGRSGLTEALFVGEGWEKAPNRAKRLGEVFNVSWLCRHHQKAFAYRIKQGSRRKYLDLICKDMDFTAYNPMFWPWNTNDDILDFFDIPESDRFHLDEKLSKVFSEVTGGKV
jgi:hypothetical protein